MKFFFYILITIFVIAGVVYLGYYFHSRQKPSSLSITTGIGGSLPVAPETTIQPNVSSTNNVQVFSLISQNPVMDYFVNPGNDVFFIQPDGEVGEIINGQTNLLSTSTTSDLVKTSFSFNGRKILATFGNQQNNFSAIFDIASSTWSPLTLNIQNPAWSPNNYQIAYFAGNRSGGQNLDTTNLGSRKPVTQTLLTLHEEDLIPDWIYPGEIFLSEPPSAFYQSSLWSFDLKKKILSPVVSEGYSLEVKWDPQNQEAVDIIGNRGGQGGTNYLIDDTGKTIHQLDILTLPDKCVFQKETTNSSSAPITATGSPSSVSLIFLYCAVPRNVQKLEGSPLPDAYEQKSLTTQDDFYQIDLNSGQINQVFNSGGQVLDATDLKIFDQKLFFINRIDNRLYAISLQ